MFSIRREGAAFNSGVNFQFGGGLRKPHFGIHFVFISLKNHQVVRHSLRLRFWTPKLFAHSVRYNLLEEYLKCRDAVLVSEPEYEILLSHKEESDRQQARVKRRLIAYAEKCRENNPTPKRSKYNVFPQPEDYLPHERT